MKDLTLEEVQQALSLIDSIRCSSVSLMMHMQWGEFCSKKIYKFNQIKVAFLSRRKEIYLHEKQNDLAVKDLIQLANSYTSFAVSEHQVTHFKKVREYLNEALNIPSSHKDEIYFTCYEVRNYLTPRDWKKQLTFLDQCLTFNPNHRRAVEAKLFIFKLLYEGLRKEKETVPFNKEVIKELHQLEDDIYNTIGQQVHMMKRTNEHQNIPQFVQSKINELRSMKFFPKELIQQLENTLKETLVDVNRN
jgi:hypothetical protein